MTVHRLDPVVDPRWTDFLAQHPQASIFHTPAWLKALRMTYGYEPMGVATSAGTDLTNGLVFCQVQSWLTGRRLVSLPFSDHCQPLVNGSALNTILESLLHARGAERWKYIELRPATGGDIEGSTANFAVSDKFGFHRVDLRTDLDTIYRRFHDSCVRRKIKRAEREKLTYEAGRSEELLRKFRHLLLLTRRRHKLPPQPAAWFRNLAHCLGEKLTIHVLSTDDRPIASIITLAYKSSLVYKYGCSDSHFHNLGAMSLLFWKAIQQGKQMGAEDFDLGRSDLSDPGLIAFKEHLGAVTTDLMYYRSPVPRAKKDLSIPGISWAREALVRLPDPLLAYTGRLLYRHLG
jgi:CelD/BcsL family acetyltransferase involved in cellulose biosynthesis